MPYAGDNMLVSLQHLRRLLPVFLREFFECPADVPLPAFVAFVRYHLMYDVRPRIQEPGGRQRVHLRIVSVFRHQASVYRLLVVGPRVSLLVHRCIKKKMSSQKALCPFPHRTRPNASSRPRRFLPRARQSSCGDNRNYSVPSGP